MSLTVVAELGIATIHLSTDETVTREMAETFVRMVGERATQMFLELHGTCGDADYIDEEALAAIEAATAEAEAGEDGEDE